MSDNLVAEAPERVDESPKAPGQRRLLLVVGGLAALLVFGLAAYFLFLSGGSSEEDLGPVPGAAQPNPTTSPGKGDKSAGDAKGDDKSDPTDVNVGSNPFQPLSVEAVKETEAPAADDATTGTDTGTSTGTGTGTSNGSDTSGDQSGTTPGGGVQPQPAPTTAAPSPTPTQTEEPSDPTHYKVTLKSADVAKDSAVIEVNGKRYVVKVKELFTNSKTGPFKLVWVGERPDGKDIAQVVFGSDAPVELVQKDSVVFEV